MAFMIDHPCKKSRRRPLVVSPKNVQRRTTAARLKTQVSWDTGRRFPPLGRVFRGGRARGYLTRNTNRSIRPPIRSSVATISMNVFMVALSIREKKNRWRARSNKIYHG